MNIEYRTMLLCVAEYTARRGRSQRKDSTERKTLPSPVEKSAPNLTTLALGNISSRKHFVQSRPLPLPMFVQSDYLANDRRSPKKSAVTRCVGCPPRAITHDHSCERKVTRRPLHQFTPVTKEGRKTDLCLQPYHKHKAMAALFAGPQVEHRLYVPMLQ